jgi:hypothetical protein
MTLKTAVVAPIPSANDTNAVSAVSQEFRLKPVTPRSD